MYWVILAGRPGPPSSAPRAAGSPREQLQDDAGGDVGHDPQREDRQLEQRTAGEQVDQAVDAAVALHVAEARLHVGDVDARGRDCEPSRKIAMINRTNSSLRRRSGVRKALANALARASSFCAARPVASGRRTTPVEDSGKPNRQPVADSWRGATDRPPRASRLVMHRFRLEPQTTVAVPPAASIFSLAERGERVGAHLDGDRDLALAQHLDRAGPCGPRPWRRARRR